MTTIDHLSDRWRQSDPAVRRYTRRAMIAMVAYAVLLVGVQRLFALDTLHGPVRWLLAILPALPIAAVFWLIGAMIGSMRDEYRRMLEVRKALIATGVTMTLVSIWGFAEMLADAPHLPLFYVPVIWFGSLGVGSCVNALIERRGA